MSGSSADGHSPSPAWFQAAHEGAGSSVDTSAGRGCRLDQARERVSEGLCRVVRTRKRDAARDAGLRGCDVVAERDDAGERLRTRIAGQAHAALDFDACRYPRRVRANLDYDLAVVGQPEADHGG
jgi:hypothetical protein